MTWRKIIWGTVGGTAMVLGTAGILKSEFQAAKEESEKATGELIESVIQENDFWGAPTPEQVERSITQITQDYLEEAHRRNLPMGTSQYRAIRERLWALYHSEAIRNEFLSRDSTGKAELYNLLIEYGSLEPVIMSPIRQEK